MLFLLALLACQPERSNDVPPPKSPAKVLLSTKRGDCKEGDVITYITITTVGGDISLVELELKPEVPLGATIVFDAPPRTSLHGPSVESWVETTKGPRILGPRKEIYSILVNTDETGKGETTIRLVQEGDTPCSPIRYPIKRVMWLDENTHQLMED